MEGRISPVFPICWTHFPGVVPQLHQCWHPENMVKGTLTLLRPGVGTWIILTLLFRKGSQ
jgi:hypothetical protein